MPILRLRFSGLETILSAGIRASIIAAAFFERGCTFKPCRNVPILKSLVGDTEFWKRESDSRVGKALNIMEAIADLPHDHCSLYFLGYKI